MSRINFVKMASVVAVAIAGSQLCAATVLTYAVGTCLPKLPTFGTISAAVAATPAQGVIKVCPGIYNEQVVITQPVTLEGISDGNSDQVIIAVPGGGFVPNTFDMYGEPVGAQVLVDSVTGGDVNIRNITVDGTNDGTSPISYLAGIVYQDSSGTVNRVTARNQAGVGFYSTGVWLRGSSDPSVTVENSDIHDFDFDGILSGEVGGFPSSLTTTIKGNQVLARPDCACSGIFLQSGTRNTVTANFIADALSGIYMETGVTGSISANTLMSNYYGVTSGADGSSITSNKIFGGSTAITAYGNTTQVQSNTIVMSKFGIDFDCHSNPDVNANTMNDVTVGVVNVPPGVSTKNSYFNVGTIRVRGFCLPFTRKP
ncbi:MAG: DUF1565 domain-containing protein [Acidobacteriia bacterium]|nr:DUF1565 domain-containing protein [Terriglobia bacterium]